MSIVLREAKKYAHTQEIASDTWVITHNRGLNYPIVDCFIDENGDTYKVMPLSVEITSDSVVTVRWSSERAGKALVA